MQCRPFACFVVNWQGGRVEQAAAGKGSPWTPANVTAMATTVLTARPAARVGLAQVLATSARPALPSRAALAPRQALARKSVGAFAPLKAAVRPSGARAVRASAAAAPGPGAGRSEDTQICRAADVAVPGDNNE